MSCRISHLIARVTSSHFVLSATSERYDELLTMPADDCGLLSPPLGISERVGLTPPPENFKETIPGSPGLCRCPELPLFSFVVL